MPGVRLRHSASNARNYPHTTANTPLVVTLRNPDLDRVATERPATVAAAYRKAAAEELLASREEALAQMRRTGAVVLDVEPERASTAVVEAYLELKRRGRL